MPVAEALPRPVGYVLAGGRSSRMGQDKAALHLSGATLLEIALRKLEPVCDEVAVVGPGMAGVRTLADDSPGCGPLGGMEAALAEGRGEWAAFLPVDMPLLPDGLLRALLGVWASYADGGALVCFAVSEGRAQPLVSVVRRTVLPFVRDGLQHGQLRVRFVLEAAAEQLAHKTGVPVDAALRRTEVRIRRDGNAREVMIDGTAVWQASPAEWAMRALWFSNLNTPAEFAAAERLASRSPVREDGEGSAAATGGTTDTEMDGTKGTETDGSERNGG